MAQKISSRTATENGASRKRDIAMKRSRKSQKDAYKAHKRQKLDQIERPPSSKSKRTVRLDDLQWKAVSMPDRLDDCEGFYGLEEIDDVDVIRNDTTGQLQFETSRSEEQVEREKEEGWRLEQEELQRLQEEIGKGEQQEEEQENGEQDAEEWEGFSDEEVPDAESKPETDATAELANEGMSSEDEPNGDGAAPKSKKQKKQQEKHAPAATNGTQKDMATDTGRDGGIFDILTNRSMDEDDDDVVDVSAWDPLDLSRETLAQLSKLKFSQPTPIQSSAIPEILDGRDVIGKASTGSGKTLAFGVPILESYLRSKPTREDNSPTALIISPTRELAHQISAHLTALCTSGDFDAPFIATITGGLSVQKQRRLLERADIVVGTPGRLWEVISSGHGLMFSFKQIRYLVVDEADRLLSEGHYKELGEILNILERDEEGEEDESKSDIKRQTLVFSATFHKGLQQKLAGKKKSGDLMNKAESMEYLLRKLRFREEKPKFIDANPTSQMATGLREGLIECAGTEKDLYLYALLLFNSKKRALIFTNSIAAVRRLAPFLKNLNLPALPLHSEMPQKARLRSVERFTEQSGSILVATDVAARGLDIPGVQLIVHYHLPRAADTYVHRSGRTARAETSGSSILICAPEEVAGVRRLVAKVHARSEQAAKPGKKSAYYIRTLDIDRRVVSRLRPRATLSKRLADAENAKGKQNKKDDLFLQAAEDLGVEYDSDAFEAEAKGKRGRGSGRKKKEKEAREMSKAEMQGLRAELKGMLAQRVNVGVSERYLTSGGIDVDALMRQEGNLEFLGRVDGLGFEEEEEDDG